MRRLKSQTGNDLVEFALVLPLVLILVFGIVDFGFAMYDKAVITNASREGVRAGILARDSGRLSDTEIETVVTNYLGSRLVTFGAGGPSVSVARAGSGTGDSLTVTVSYDYTHLAIASLIPGLGTLNLTATTVMRME